MVSHIASPPAGLSWRPLGRRQWGAVKRRQAKGRLQGGKRAPGCLHQACRKMPKGCSASEK
ncbi:hypothetical protein HMPREF9946_05275 [Acetobacteraceae bacterium AT-5844]|nr:hypothetical protein HMPREF9946_05275 [Acetobacteraceae bacterium AT-5844]